MKKLKQNITRLLAAVFVLTSFASCDEVGDTDPGGTSTESMAGDWYVQTLVDGKVVADYALISTYNTAANDGKEFWIDDHGHVWDFKVKTPVTIGTLSFAGNNLPSSIVHDVASTPEIETYDVNVTITEGKITKNDTKTSGGNTTDGISFKAVFSDDTDAGTVYEIRGYKRTGFLEDEH
ncbi:lipid-binding protein [Flavobacterium sp. DG2-3]|uniref:lipid-binding protein n=1 Tax=Flavobacterium sp. DG2-3 TaxID=3068317 RepID=UPI00273F339E|nr:lipid-binding protein [Flavobacterium sp. DG2-3]MDP5200784.1 lipid-binding protein [Flavobacterium sp. DG2-3]